MGKAAEAAEAAAAEEEGNLLETEAAELPPPQQQQKLENERRFRMVLPSREADKRRGQLLTERVALGRPPEKRESEFPGNLVQN